MYWSDKTGGMATRFSLVTKGLILNFIFIAGLLAVKTVIWLHSNTTKDFNCAFGFHFRAAAVETTDAVSTFYNRFRSGCVYDIG
jgi:hypothetical protein